MSTDRIKDVLFAAGPQWGDRSPDDIIKALDAAGYVIVPKEPTKAMITAVYSLDLPPINGHDVCKDDLLAMWRAMIKATAPAARSDG